MQQKQLTDWTNKTKNKTKLKKHKKKRQNTLLSAVVKQSSRITFSVFAMSEYYLTTTRRHKKTSTTSIEQTNQPTKETINQSPEKKIEKNIYKK